MKKKELFGRIAFGLAAILLPLTMVGCGRNHSTNYFNSPSAIKGDVSYSAAAPMYEADYDSSYYEYEEDYVYDDYAEPSVETGLGRDTGSGLTENDMASNKETNRKLIRTVNLSVETTSFEETLRGIDSEISRLGGYIENEYTYNGSKFNSYSDNRYATITIRVPDDKLDEFVNSVSGVANVISKSTRTEDVTLRYVDIEGKKEMYLAEEQSLLALLEKAETVEDISYLVGRLSEVRYNIESMESSLRTYDNLVDYATIELSVDEVEILTPVEEEEQSIGDQIREGFDASLKDVLYSLRRTGMNILIDSPYIIRALLSFAIFVGIIFLAIKITIAIIKKSIKKAKLKKAAKLEKNTENITKEVSDTSEPIQAEKTAPEIKEEAETDNKKVEE